MFAQHPWLVIEWRLGQGDSSRWTERRHPAVVPALWLPRRTSH